MQSTYLLIAAGAIGVAQGFVPSVNMAPAPRAASGAAAVTMSLRGTGHVCSVSCNCASRKGLTSLKAADGEFSNWKTPATGNWGSDWGSPTPAPASYSAPAPSYSAPPPSYSAPPAAAPQYSAPPSTAPAGASDGEFRNWKTPATGDWGSGWGSASGNSYSPAPASSAPSYSAPAAASNSYSAPPAAPAPSGQDGEFRNWKTPATGNWNAGWGQATGNSYSPAPASSAPQYSAPASSAPSYNSAPPPNAPAGDGEFRNWKTPATGDWGAGWGSSSSAPAAGGSTSAGDGEFRNWKTPATGDWGAGWGQATGGAYSPAPASSAPSYSAPSAPAAPSYSAPSSTPSGPSGVDGEFRNWKTPATGDWNAGWGQATGNSYSPAPAAPASSAPSYSAPAPSYSAPPAAAPSGASDGEFRNWKTPATGDWNAGWGSASGNSYSPAPASSAPAYSAPAAAAPSYSAPAPSYSAPAATPSQGEFSNWGSSAAHSHESKGGEFSNWKTGW